MGLVETFRQRIQLAKEKRAQLNDLESEYELFHKYFPQVRLDGVLTPLNIELASFEKGKLIVASYDKNIKKKLDKGIGLTSQEESQIRLAERKSIDGKYFGIMTPDGFNLTLKLDDSEVISYLNKYIDFSLCFLTFGAKSVERHPCATEISTGEDNIYATFDLKERPVDLKSFHLHIAPFAERYGNLSLALSVSR